MGGRDEKEDKGKISGLETVSHRDRTKAQKENCSDALALAPSEGFTTDIDVDIDISRQHQNYI